MTTPDVGSARGTGRRVTFYVALAVFAQESTWNFYDAQVPPLLAAHIGSAAVIGLLMGMDNLLGIVIQPWMGHRSDNTRTRWGRRIPYLAVGMPVAAVLFALIPLTSTLPALIAVMVGYALVCNSFRPATESLLPDFVRPERRSRANAAVKTASSLTIIVSALISLLLVDSQPVLAFLVPAVLMLVATAVLVTGIRDTAFPVALLAERIGRLRVMALGMALFAVALVAATALRTPEATVVALCVGGVGAAGFIVNAAVVLWNLAPSARVLGAYTGLYSVGWAGGYFLGPAAVGALVDLTGWRFMLLDAVLLVVAAVAVVLRVIVLRRRVPTGAVAP